MQNIAINFISDFFIIMIYWHICCYSICLFCWCSIHHIYNFIHALKYRQYFLILGILTNTCARILVITYFSLTIIFIFAWTCFIVSVLIWITCCAIEFVFLITWNMFCNCFSFSFVYYHSKCFNIHLFCFFCDAYFWWYDIATSCTFT